MTALECTFVTDCYIFLYRIWSFGPKRVGPNLLVNKIPGYVRKHFFDVEKASHKQSEEIVEDGLVDDEVVDVTQQDERLGILDVDFNIHTAFQLSTLTGTLCGEPLLGVCYVVEDVIVNSEEMVDPSGEPIDGKFWKNCDVRLSSRCGAHDRKPFISLQYDPRLV
jgi:translation elongation factor EF-G